MLITINQYRSGRKEFFSSSSQTAVESLYQIQAHYPFFFPIWIVIMPDHCHILMNVPEGGSCLKTIGIINEQSVSLVEVQSNGISCFISDGLKLRMTLKIFHPSM